MWLKLLQKEWQSSMFPFWFKLLCYFGSGYLHWIILFYVIFLLTTLMWVCSALFTINFTITQAVKVWSPWTDTPDLNYLKCWSTSMRGCLWNFFSRLLVTFLISSLSVLNCSSWYRYLFQTRKHWLYSWIHSFGIFEGKHSYLKFPG